MGVPGRPTRQTFEAKTRREPSHDESIKIQRPIVAADEHSKRRLDKRDGEGGGVGRGPNGAKMVEDRVLGPRFTEMTLNAASYYLYR